MNDISLTSTVEYVSSDKLDYIGRFFCGVDMTQKCVLNTHPEVTIIIPAYNEEPSIFETVTNLKEQTYPIHEIIVIDDCSTDNTHDEAVRAGAKVIRTSGNTGSKSKAQNFGVGFVTTPLFATIDADTILAPDAIEKLVPYILDENTLSVCSFVLPRHTTTFWERSRMIEYLYGCGLMKSAQAHWSTPLVSSGCFSLFNTNIFKSIGGVPEDNIAEDMAVTWKGHVLGYNVKYVNDSVCYPIEPDTWAKYKGQVIRWYSGFYQCLKDYRLEIFKNKKLAFFISVYLIVGLMALVWYASMVLLGYFIFMNGAGIITKTLLVIIMFDFVISFGTVVYNGYRFGKLKDAIIYYPLLWIISPINSALFFYSFWKECVVKDKLQVWVKGH